MKVIASKASDEIVYVGRYRDSVADLLQDQRLEDAGYTIDTYFDTADVRSALLGAQAYVGSHLPFDKVFEEARTSVQVLLSAGWLGPVRMLPPHQSELLTLLALKFGVNAENFARDAVTFKARVDSFKTMRQPRVQDDIGTAAGHAADAIPLFKYAEMARLPWPERLHEWTAHKEVLDLETIAPKYSDIMERAEFHRLYNVLADKRRDTPRNNFADAAAVVTIIAALADVQKTKRVPLVYVATRRLWEALREAEILDKFQFTFDGETVCVLRDTSYFMARGILTSRKPGVRRVQPDELRRLHGQLKQIAHTKNSLADLLLQLDVGADVIRESVLNFVELCFYTNVWRPYVELHGGTVEHLDAAIADSLNADRRRQIEGALTTVRKQLEHNAEVYRRISSSWQHFNDAATRFRERLKQSPEIDLIRAFGLSRFVPEEAVIQEAEPQLRLIGFGKDIEQRTAINSVFIAYERAIDRHSESGGKVAVTAAILWTLELDQALSKLHVSAGAGWLRVLQAASLVRSGMVRLHDVEKTIEELKVALGKESKERERLRLHIGVAYLSFHLAIRRGYRPSWLRSDPDLGTPPPPLIIDAVKHAEQAAECTSPSEYLSVYATNQALYYAVADGTVERAKLWDLSNQLLTRYGSNEWDFRFEDTLARYFFLLSRSTGDARIKREHADEAKVHIDKARAAAAQGDHTVDTFCTILQTYRDSLAESTEPLAAEVTE